MFKKNINKFIFVNSFLNVNKTVCSDDNKYIKSFKIPSNYYFEKNDKWKEGSDKIGGSDSFLVLNENDGTKNNMPHENCKNVKEGEIIPGWKYILVKKIERPLYYCPNKCFREFKLTIYVVKSIITTTTTPTTTTGSATGKTSLFADIKNIFKNMKMGPPVSKNASEYKPAPKPADPTKYDGKFNITYKEKNYIVKFTFIENEKETDLVRFKKADNEKNFDSILGEYITTGKGLYFALLKRSIYEKDGKGCFETKLENSNRYNMSFFNKNSITKTTSGDNVEIKISLVPKKSTTTVPGGIPGVVPGVGQPEVVPVGVPGSGPLPPSKGPEPVPVIGTEGVLQPKPNVNPNEGDGNPNEGTGNPNEGTGNPNEGTGNPNEETGNPNGNPNVNEAEQNIPFEQPITQSGVKKENENKNKKKKYGCYNKNKAQKAKN